MNIDFYRAITASNCRMIIITPIDSTKTISLHCLFALHGGNNWSIEITDIYHKIIENELQVNKQCFFYYTCIGILCKRFSH